MNNEEERKKIIGGGSSTFISYRTNKIDFLKQSIREPVLIQMSVQYRCVSSYSYL